MSTREDPKYPWQAKVEQAPYTMAYAVVMELRWALMSAADGRQQTHARTALVEMDALVAWLTGPSGFELRAHLKRLAEMPVVEP